MFDRNFIVLELANILAGPITAMFFAELGAASGVECNDARCAERTRPGRSPRSQGNDCEPGRNPPESVPDQQ